MRKPYGGTVTRAEFDELANTVKAIQEAIYELQLSIDLINEGLSS